MTCFTACRSIGGFSLQRNDQLRILLINHEMVSFTPMEYRLILTLLDHEVVSDGSLVQELFALGTIDQLLLKNLKKHVENTKRKLAGTGLAIRRVYRFGYALVTGSAPRAAGQSTLPPFLEYT